MCIFLDRVAGFSSIETICNFAVSARKLALLRGLAGELDPKWGQNGPRHYKGEHSCHWLGSEINPNVQNRAISTLSRFGF